MAMTAPRKSKTPLILIALIAVQSFCTVFFIADVLADFQAMGGMAAAQVHLYIEALAALSLVAAVVVETNFLLKLLRRKAFLENSLQIANSAIYDVIEAEFESWQLTPAEQDVATFLVKGLSTAEIAEMRGSAEGTVKAHLNAIYRKSGTRNRAEMLSALIDSLMGQPAP
ncbi:MAG: DNA-binding NarL/FixJ family response regulator [Paracoccaceae bacterium]|jgi:DNA-binding NarL/FixJ family response regulator